MSRRFQRVLRGLLDAIGYEPAHRRVWIVAYGTATLFMVCCAILAFVVDLARNPGHDNYVKVEQLLADFEAVYLLHGGDLLPKFRTGFGPSVNARDILVAVRGRQQASVYLKDAGGEIWKVTPDRFFAPSTIPTEWHYQYKDGVLSGRWGFTVTPPTPPAPPGTRPVTVNDEFSVVLNDQSRMK